MSILDIFKFGKKAEKKLWLPVGASARSRMIYSSWADCFKNSAFYSCVTLICNQVATLPLTPHEEGSYRAMGKDRLLYYLLEQPNPYMNHVEFMKLMMLNYLLMNESVAIKGYATNGRCNALYPVSPRSVTRTWQNGEQLFTITGTDGAKTYHRDELLIVRGQPISYDEDLCAIAYAEEGLELAEKAKALQSEYYEGGSVLGKFIKVPQNSYNELKETLKETFDSARKYRNIVVPDSVSIDPIKADGEDISRLIQAQSWDVEEVSRRFHVPKRYLGDTQGGYGSVEQQSIQFVQECLQPICKAWEASFNADVCAPGEYVKFDLQSLLRGDHAARQAWYTQMLTHGVYSVNEVRALEDLEPIGAEGDVHYFQSGFANIKDIASGAFTKDAGTASADTSSPEPEKADESALPGVLVKLAVESGAISVKGLGAALGVTDSKWLEKYDEGMQQRLADGADKTNEVYRLINALLVKHATDYKLRYTVEGKEPDDDGYFRCEGKKFRNPPMFPGDTRIVKEQQA